MNFFRLCHNCRKEGTNLSQCGKCKVAHYCSRECQTNDWCTHKYTCTLTTISHTFCSQGLNAIVTNKNYISLVKSLTYHFLKENPEMMLMCVLGFEKPSSTGEAVYSGSFLVFPRESDQKCEESERLVWIMFVDKYKNRSEGGFRFSIDECEKDYNSISSKISFENVTTETNDVLPGSKIEFDITEIKKHIACIFTDKRIVINYNGENVLL